MPWASAAHYQQRPADSPTTISFDQYSLGVQVPSSTRLLGGVRNLREARRRRCLATVEGERAFRLSLIGQVPRPTCKFSRRGTDRSCRTHSREPAGGARYGAAAHRCRCHVHVDYDRPGCLSRKWKPNWRSCAAPPLRTKCADGADRRASLPSAPCVPSAWRTGQPHGDDPACRRPCSPTGPIFSGRTAVARCKHHRRGACGLPAVDLADGAGRVYIARSR